MDPDFHKQNTLPGLEAKESISAAFEVPKKIGPYKIESLLEKGGMSYVYLGTHPDTTDPVTIKVLLPKYLSHPEIVQRFLKEAGIIALADHTNIVKLYGHGEWEGGLYIAMEFIEGISLRQYLQHNPISLKRALEIILEISYALCHLHAHGIIHRDLKLENILVTEAGGIKVIDFGIAQLLAEKTEDSKEPIQQRLIGTPIYMSPEQRENPESVSYPSDIYSLGIISYELILGKLSHGRIHLSLMPKGIQKILAKALQPRIEDRYQDVVDFITDVSAYLNSTSLQKEKKEGDQLSELAERFQQAQMALVPRAPPKWKEMDLGFIYHKEGHATGLYYDFFSLPQGGYAVVIAEPTARGAEGMVYSAVLRGMIKTLVRTTTKAAELVSFLNDFLLQDQMEQTCTMCYLALYPNSNQFQYISCGFGKIWHFRTGVEEPQGISAENVALGVDRTIELREEMQDWQVGDILILSSLAGRGANESSFKQIMIDNQYVPPQKQVEAIIRKTKALGQKPNEERSQVIISIQRVE